MLVCCIQCLHALKAHVLYFIQVPTNATYIIKITIHKLIYCGKIQSELHRILLRFNLL